MKKAIHIIIAVQLIVMSLSGCVNDTFHYDHSYSKVSACIVMIHPKIYDGDRLSITGKVVPGSPILVDDQCTTTPIPFVSGSRKHNIPGRSEFDELIFSILFSHKLAVLATFLGKFQWPEDDPWKRGFVVEEIRDQVITTAPNTVGSR